MLKRKVRGKTNSFMRFMVSYLIILGLTISIGGLAYNEALKMAKEDAIQDGLSALKKSRDVLEARFVEVDNMIDQLAMNQEVINMLNIKNPMKTQDYYKLRSAFLKLPSYNIINSFIDDFYIFSKNTEALISSNAMSVRTQSFYKESLSYENMDYKEWKNEILGTYHYKDIWPAHSVIKGYNPKPELTYVQSIPMGEPYNYKGAIMVLIDENKVLEYLMTPDIANDGWACIVDSSDRIITSANMEVDDLNSIDMAFELSAGYKEEMVNGQDVVVLYAESFSRDWTYITVLPSGIFREQVSGVRGIFVISIMATLLIGLITAFILASRNSMPIKRLIKRLQNAVGNNSPTSNEYDFIEDTVLQLVRNNKDLREYLEKQVPFLRVSFFERLLRGGFSQLKDIEAASSYARIDIKGEYFIVLVMKLNSFAMENDMNNSNETNVKRVVAAKEVTERLPWQNYLHDVDQDKVAVLTALSHNDIEEFDDKIEDVLKPLVDELQQNYNIIVSFGIGNICTDLLGINKSFREAIKALDYYRYGGKVKRIAWFKDIALPGLGYHYPIETEMRLINLTETGEEEEALSLLNELLAKNFTRDNLSEQDMEDFIYEIRGTITKIKNEILTQQEQDAIGISGLMEKMNEYQSIEDISESIISIFKSLCAYVQQKKQSRRDDMLREIIEYIKVNYIDDGLCLASIASKFGLTEKYLSQFFKDRTGENLSTYVERLRMENAAEMLIESKLPIADIASHVGYNNNNTFYKAFRRIYGVSPSVYRQHKMENTISHD
ncbi:helix-turn-helix domain-containing protein [Mahella australiensis]|uniref:Transcriptional regulator, AraC family n=1 Tax=Mahella australiensis (strain DSM 15567 / CIP 107919 / 50-1 BON) TaxID=697281 RepID=F4A187_MAHA5|nr:helix-turn-helix domain-containing protein [Mahella australiensis]AEE97006.1 transcriptional regulator, AraC family [Mahella australiensis 50-1 BON]